jgi:hypothetical protein
MLQGLTLQRRQSRDQERGWHSCSGVFDEGCTSASTSCPDAYSAEVCYKQSCSHHSTFVHLQTTWSVLSSVTKDDSNIFTDDSTHVSPVRNIFNVMCFGSWLLARCMRSLNRLTMRRSISVKPSLSYGVKTPIDGKLRSRGLLGENSSASSSESAG